MYYIVLCLPEVEAIQKVSILYLLRQTGWAVGSRHLSAWLGGRTEGAVEEAL